MPISSYHNYGSFDIKGRKKIVARVVKDLRKYQFDAIAVRGVSGLTIGPIVAYLLGKHLIVTRKSREEEPSHADHLVESMISKGTYIILDDFIGGGHTARKIRDMVTTAYPELILLGGYVYVEGRQFAVPGIKGLNS